MKMKKIKKIKSILALMLAAAMMVMLAACGGGDGESAAAAEQSEPNAGMSGIVYTLPDGWELKGIYGERNVSYSTTEEGFELSVSSTNDEDIKEWGEDDIKDIDEYYAKYYQKPSNEELEKNNTEAETLTICDTEAGYYKNKNAAGEYALLHTAWMYNGEVYSVVLSNDDNYDPETGNLKDDAASISDDVVAKFEDVLASIRPGDGSAFASVPEGANSLGMIEFDIPEGYTPTSVADGYIELKKDGSEAVIRVNRTTAEDVSRIEFDDGQKFDSLESYYEMFGGTDGTTIAGHEGYLFNYPNEDGKHYDCSAGFLGDDAIYDFAIGTDAYDENGLKADAVSLTDEDLAVFDAFVASVRMK